MSYNSARYKYHVKYRKLKVSILYFVKWYTGYEKQNWQANIFQIIDKYKKILSNIIVYQETH